MPDREGLWRRAARSLQLRLLWREYSIRRPGPCQAWRRLPTGTRLSATIDGQPLRLDRGQNLEHRRILDMRHGILWREWRHQDGAGRITRLRALRLASLADRHLLVQCVEITPENYSGRVSIDATLSGPVVRVTSSGTTVAMAMARRITDSTGPGHPHLKLLMAGKALNCGKAKHTDLIASLPYTPPEIRASRAKRRAPMSSALSRTWPAWSARIEMPGWRDGRFLIFGLMAIQRPSGLCALRSTIC